MVGYHPEQRLLSQSEYAAAGAFSGVFTRVVIQPLDVIKIRFQVRLFYIKNAIPLSMRVLFSEKN